MTKKLNGAKAAPNPRGLAVGNRVVGIGSWHWASEFRESESLELVESAMERGTQHQPTSLLQEPHKTCKSHALHLHNYTNVNVFRQVHVAHRSQLTPSRPLRIAPYIGSLSSVHALFSQRVTEAPRAVQRRKYTGENDMEPTKRKKERKQGTETTMSRTLLEPAGATPSLVELCAKVYAPHADVASTQHVLCVQLGEHGRLEAAGEVGQRRSLE